MDPTVAPVIDYLKSVPLDAPLTVFAVSVGLTQLAKDLGVQGHWLKLVCVAVGAAYTIGLNLTPGLLAQGSAVLYAAAATGLVSFVQDLRSSRTRPVGEAGA
jgi:hypothetical protein